MMPLPFFRSLFSLFLLFSLSYSSHTLSLAPLRGPLIPAEILPGDERMKGSNPPRRFVLFCREWAGGRCEIYELQLGQFFFFFASKAMQKSVRRMGYPDWTASLSPPYFRLGVVVMQLKRLQPPLWRATHMFGPSIREYAQRREKEWLHDPRGIEHNLYSGSKSSTPLHNISFLLLCALRYFVQLQRVRPLFQIGFVFGLSPSGRDRKLF